MTSPASGVPANDAHLVQLVRGALGRNPETRDLPRPNVSSCKLVVTLHGCVRSAEESRRIEEVARGTSGVRGLENKIKVAAPMTAGRLFSG